MATLLTVLTIVITLLTLIYLPLEIAELLEKRVPQLVGWIRKRKHKWLSMKRLPKKLDE
jgi:hypothetical protein